jgi:hypothetical protein
VGDVTEPEGSDVTDDVDANPHSVRVEIEDPAARSPRPYTGLMVAISVLAFAVVVHGTWSRAAQDQPVLRVRTNAGSSADADPPPAELPIVSAPIETTTSTTSTTVASSTTTTVDGTVDATVAATSTTIVPAATGLVDTAAVPDPTVAGGDGGDDAVLVGRPIPDPITPPSVAIPSPWADVSRVTSAGYVATDVGCAAGTSAGALDAFFRERVGPVIGVDYQHVYALGGGRYLWLFQDTFVDYSGAATRLDQATFMHNSAMLQDGACFTLYHRGALDSPASFEQGSGEVRLGKWFWPMGGETYAGKLYVFWAEMSKDAGDPAPPNGLGWHPARTWLAVYDARTLARLSFGAAPNTGVAPIYGYAVASDAEYTYLFGNTFEQNLSREGGYFNGPHSATNMWLARMPVGNLSAPLEYRSGDAWTDDAAAATPIVQRSWAEFPMQPRYLNGQWVAATKVNGYWGEQLAIDVANDPWGPWTTVEQRALSPRGGDPLMNTYHAHLMPWLSGGSLVVSVSQNARNMQRDAWPNPARYRLQFVGSALVAPPPRPAPIPAETTTTTIAEESTTTIPETTTTTADSTTTVATTTTVPPTTTTSTTVSPSTTTSTTTLPPPTTSTTTTTTADDPTTTSTSTP